MCVCYGGRVYLSRYCFIVRSSQKKGNSNYNMLRYFLLLFKWIFQGIRTFFWKNLNQHKVTFRLLWGTTNSHSKLWIVVWPWFLSLSQIFLSLSLQEKLEQRHSRHQSNKIRHQTYYQIPLPDNAHRILSCLIIVYFFLQMGLEHVTVLETKLTSAHMVWDDQFPIWSVIVVILKPHIPPNAWPLLRPRRENKTVTHTPNNYITQQITK